MKVKTVTTRSPSQGANQTEEMNEEQDNEESAGGDEDNDSESEQRSDEEELEFQFNRIQEDWRGPIRKLAEEWQCDVNRHCSPVVKYKH